MMPIHALDTIEELRVQIVEGLHYVHHQLGANTGKALETTSFLYALIELLMKKGLLTERELNEQKVEVAKRLVEKSRELGMGAVFQDSENDKYAFAGREVKIDWENRVHLCGATCCRLNFALSHQDIQEGVVKWDLGRPYLIAHDPDGYCRHLDREGCRCTVYANRPVPCRAYDCRKDKRIWMDFHSKIINPRLEELFRDPKSSLALGNTDSKFAQTERLTAAPSQGVHDR